MLESDAEINCPYCGELIVIRVDQTGGRRQHFVTDCEICCKPIEIEAEVSDDDEVSLTAKREGEG